MFRDRARARTQLKRRLLGTTLAAILVSPPASSDWHGIGDGKTNLECNNEMIKDFVKSANGSNRMRGLGLEIVDLDHLTNVDVKDWPMKMTCHAIFTFSDGRVVPGIITLKPSNVDANIRLRGFRLDY
jgi:hypothetical protein